MGSKKKISIPEESESLSEFLGIFIGDGSIRNDFQVAISFNWKTEEAYANFISALVNSLFGLETTKLIRPRYGSADLLINSRALVEFLSQNGIEKGNKIQKRICLPAWILNDKRAALGAIRGLFDTDGCVYQHIYMREKYIYKYPKLAFTSYSSVVRRQFFNLLAYLGFFPKEYRNRVYLYSQENVLEYFEKIGTHNPSYQKRFETFLEDLLVERFFSVN